MRYFLFLIILCLMCTACTNHKLKTECMEMDCTMPASANNYCITHEAVYAHEREFYPLVQQFINAIKNTPGYTTNSTFQLKDVYIHYVQPSDIAIPYTLELYAHYIYQNDNHYVSYIESEKQTGSLPALTPCSQDTYSKIQKAAHGGLHTHSIKERAGHYSTPVSENYIYNEYFSVNPTDFKTHKQ